MGIYDLLKYADDNIVSVIKHFLSVIKHIKHFEEIYKIAMSWFYS